MNLFGIYLILPLVKLVWGTMGLLDISQEKEIPQRFDKSLKAKTT